MSLTITDTRETATTDGDGADLRELPVDRQDCPTCGAAVPMHHVTDKVIRRRVTKEPRRIVRLDCHACGRGHVVRMRLVAGRVWRPIGGVMVIAPAQRDPDPRALRRAARRPV